MISGSFEKVISKNGKQNKPNQSTRLQIMYTNITKNRIWHYINYKG